MITPNPPASPLPDPPVSHVAANFEQASSPQDWLLAAALPRNWLCADANMFTPTSARTSEEMRDSDAFAKITHITIKTCIIDTSFPAPLRQRHLFDDTNPNMEDLNEMPSRLALLCLIGWRRHIIIWCG